MAPRLGDNFANQSAAVTASPRRLDEFDPKYTTF